MRRTINHPALQPLKARFADTKLLVAEFRDMATVVVPREKLLNNLARVAGVDLYMTATK